MRSIIYVLLLLVFAPMGWAAPTPSEENINTLIKNTIMVKPGQSPVDGVRERISLGKNLQIICSIPGAKERGGDLLDPTSVKVMWAGKELETFVLYKLNDIAMIFAIPDAKLIHEHPESELSFTASLVGSDNVDAGWILPITMGQDALTTMDLSLKNTRGRKIFIRDENSAPIAAAKFYGQRREDLFGAANAQGIGLLDAPTRNSPGSHYAWAPGYWSRGFDPISEPDIKLSPKGGNSVDKRIVLKFANGKPVENGVLLIDMNYYHVYKDGDPDTVQVPADRKSTIWCVVAGTEPQRIEVEPEGEDIQFVLGEKNP